MIDAILLVRHTEVARAWRGYCYSVSDTGLSRAGAAHAAALAADLARWQPDIVLHSGLRRTRHLARLVAATAGVESRSDPQWRERDFGTWEGMSWTAIHRATGKAMDGMIDAPDSFRPGGGETTLELADRAITALAAVSTGRVIVVTHGGPIAALRGRRLGLAAHDWLALVPALGEACDVARIV